MDPEALEEMQKNQAAMHKSMGDLQSGNFSSGPPSICLSGDCRHSRNPEDSIRQDSRERRTARRQGGGRNAPRGQARTETSGVFVGSEAERAGQEATMNESSPLAKPCNAAECGPNVQGIHGV